MQPVQAGVVPQICRDKNALEMCPRKIKTRRVITRTVMFLLLASANDLCHTEVIGVMYKEKSIDYKISMEVYMDWKLILRE